MRINERAEIKPSIVVRCENKLNPQWKNDQRKKWSKDWMNNEIWCWNGIDGYEWNAAGATDLRENNEAGKKELMISISLVSISEIRFQKWNEMKSECYYNSITNIKHKRY